MNHQEYVVDIDIFYQLLVNGNTGYPLDEIQGGGFKYWGWGIIVSVELVEVVQTDVVATTSVDQEGVMVPHNRARLTNVQYGTLNCIRSDLMLGGGEGSIVVVEWKIQDNWYGVLVICD